MAKSKYLGYANGWKDTPAIVTACKERGHTVKGLGEQGRCVHRYGCDICGYSYDVDSGD
jgi:hypothetical protein